MSKFKNVKIKHLRRLFEQTAFTTFHLLSPIDLINYNLIERFRRVVQYYIIPRNVTASEIRWYNKKKIKCIISVVKHCPVFHKIIRIPSRSKLIFGNDKTHHQIREEARKY